MAASGGLPHGEHRFLPNAVGTLFGKERCCRTECPVHSGAGILPNTVYLVPDEAKSQVAESLPELD